MTNPLEITGSRHFLDWLHQEQISLAFTTYQSNRLFLLGRKPDGRMSAFERLFDRAMGLYVTPEKLYMSSRYQLWQFDNIVPSSQNSEIHNSSAQHTDLSRLPSVYQDYDKIYVPRIGYTTGDLDIHDIAIASFSSPTSGGINTEQVIFVNTLYSCLATLSDRHSFQPLWKPPFISKLAPEDRCHLNGLAIVDGKPSYVTAISQSDVTDGWREKRQNGGILIEVNCNEVILTGLSMPHSPRFYPLQREKAEEQRSYPGKLWLLNSGTGEFGYVDIHQGRFEPVTFCPGYARGLAFWKDYAIVGLSKPRDKTFSGLPLDENLATKNAEARCGLLVINLITGDIDHWMKIEGVITELYDVQVLPGVRQPMSLGFKTNEIKQLITFDSILKSF